MDIDRKKTLRQIERDYLDDIDSIAREWLAEGQDEDWLHETIDGHRNVIYPYRARIVLVCSDNPDAYAEDFGDGTPTVEQQTYAAMMRDVREQAEHIKRYAEEHEDAEATA